MQKCGFCIIKRNGLNAFRLFLYDLPLNWAGIGWFLVPGCGGNAWSWFLAVFEEFVSGFFRRDGIRSHYMGGIGKNEWKWSFRFTCIHSHAYSVGIGCIPRPFSPSPPMQFIKRNSDDIVTAIHLVMASVPMVLVVKFVIFAYSYIP
jgi:hypothetical protein